MKHFAVGIFVVTLAAAPSAFSDQTTKMKKIDEMFVLTKADQTLRIMQEQARSGIRSQLAAVGMQNADAIANELDRVLIPLMNQEMSWDKLKPRLTSLYDETFSEEEITSILDFYHTPAGKALLEKMPVLTAKSAALGQEMMRAVMPKFMEELPKIIERVGNQPPNSALPPPAPKAK